MQNLTPLEIQKQTFARKLKGFDPQEVRAYLQLIAEEIERLGLQHRVWRTHCRQCVPTAPGAGGCCMDAAAKRTGAGGRS